MAFSFYLYANPYREESVQAVAALARVLVRRGETVFTEPWLAEKGIGAASPDGIPEGVQAAAVFGGDGTLLRLAPEAARKRVPVFGVHAGTVGFLMEGRADEPEKTADALENAHALSVSLPLLRVEMGAEHWLALNDLSVTRGEHPGVITVKVFADGERVFSPRGDGALISTALGSTAYALAAGGPVLRPDVPCVVVSPINSRELQLRPAVLPLSARITLQTDASPRRRIQAAIDGQTLITLTGETEIFVTQARETLTMLQMHPGEFFRTLREKQHRWNELQEQE